MITLRIIKPVLTVLILFALAACGAYDQNYRIYTEQVQQANQSQQLQAEQARIDRERKAESLRAMAKDCSHDLCRMMIGSQAALVSVAGFNDGGQSGPQLIVPQPPTRQRSGWLDLGLSALNAGVSIWSVERNADVAISNNRRQVDQFNALGSGYVGITQQLGGVLSEALSASSQDEPAYQAGGDLYVVGGDVAHGDQIGGDRGHNIGAGATFRSNSHDDYSSNDNSINDHSTNINDDHSSVITGPLFPAPVIQPDPPVVVVPVIVPPGAGGEPAPGVLPGPPSPVGQ
ncbi:MAG: hypothetical protein MI750_10300 [Xanthomonadales bacterium]|nr:hypothetical protein [Xanthomonadales bacterium]